MASLRYMGSSPVKTAQRRGKRASGRSGLGSGVRESSKCLGNRSELSRAMAENLRWKWL